MRKTEHLYRLGQIFRAYRSKKTKGVPLPIRLWVEPNPYCNLKCPMCPQSEPRITEITKGKAYMDFELYKKIIDEAADHVYDINLAHRGESLFHKNLPAMIRYASEKGIKTRLHTNATIMNEKWSQNLLESGLDFLSFSFDGFKKEPYEKIRIGSNFEKTLTNILQFLRMKKERGAKKPYTVFQVIELDGNTQGKEEFIRQFDDLPLDQLYIKKPHNWGGTIHSEVIDKQCHMDSYSHCSFLWYSLTILWDGHVTPCPQDFFSEYVLGDLRTQTIKEVWDGQPLVGLRDSLARQEWQKIRPCNTCDRLWRKKVAGLPKINLRSFVSDNLVGYNFLNRFFRTRYEED
ncbi:MAG: radical SAM protein [Acidobacteria bacterium]|nr:MAG: radical SAM protein [Acidobacteriota bacterium]